MLQPATMAAVAAEVATPTTATMAATATATRFTPRRGSITKDLNGKCKAHMGRDRDTLDIHIHTHNVADVCVCAHLLNPLNALPAQLGRHSHLHCTRVFRISVFRHCSPTSPRCCSYGFYCCLLLCCVVLHITFCLAFLSFTCCPSSRPMSAAIALLLLLLLPFPSLHRKRHP